MTIYIYTHILQKVAQRPFAKLRLFRLEMPAHLQGSELSPSRPDFNKAPCSDMQVLLLNCLMNRIFV